MFLTPHRYEVQEQYLLDNKAKIQNISPAGQNEDIDAIMDNCIVEAFADSCVAPKGTWRYMLSSLISSRPSRRPCLCLSNQYMLTLRSLPDGTASLCAGFRSNTPLVDDRVRGVDEKYIPIPTASDA